MGERRKGNFHQKELAIQTREMNVLWSRTHSGPHESVVDR